MKLVMEWSHSHSYYNTQQSLRALQNRRLRTWVCKCALVWQLLTFYSHEIQTSFKWKCNKNKCLNARNNCDKCQEVTTSLCANTVRYFVGDTVTVYILWMVNKPNWLMDCLHVCVFYWWLFLSHIEDNSDENNDFVMGDHFNGFQTC